jgi:hypothetical protein
MFSYNLLKTNNLCIYMDFGLSFAILNLSINSLTGRSNQNGIPSDSRPLRAYPRRPVPPQAYSHPKPVLPPAALRLPDYGVSLRHGVLLDALEVARERILPRSRPGAGRPSSCPACHAATAGICPGRLLFIPLPSVSLPPARWPRPRSRSPWRWDGESRA